MNHEAAAGISTAAEAAAAQAPTRPAPPAPPAPRRRWAYWLVAGLGMAAALAAGEWAGWPFLGQPVAQLLSARLHRDISFEARGANTLRVHFIDGLRVEAAQLQIGAPAWSSRGPMLVAQQVQLALRYVDLLALQRGSPLRVKRLAAQQMALQLERLDDGRASWQLGPGSQAPRGGLEGLPVFDGLRFDHLVLTAGSLRLRDAPAELDLQLRFALSQPGTAMGGPAGVPTDVPASPADGLDASAQGQFRNQALTATLRTGNPLTWLSANPDAPLVPVHLRLQTGRTELRFKGGVQDLLGRQGLSGDYVLRGPSLAKVGEPLGLTLPTTAPFSVQGHLDRKGPVWHTVVQQARIGRSQLKGDFTFTAAPGTTPRLTGTLAGTALWLADLGPAVGLAATPAARADKVLPDRRFDLPSLRAMNADIQIALDRLDVGTPTLSAIAPLKGHLLLDAGVLRLQDLDARVAQGSLRGDLSLDGRQAVALWAARLQVQGLKLEEWIRQTRAGDAPPYISGRLGLKLDVTGRGRSAAELLASSNGRAVVHWGQGTVSHLLTEAAGLDVAQAIGVWIKGDESLPVLCGAADLDFKNGTVSPRVMMVDSRDSTVWVDGALSLATEQLSLIARVAPKDFSPLALRTPIHVDGSLGQPRLSVEKGPLLRRLIPAAILASINPLAALIPLVDAGDAEAKAAIETCHKVAARRLERGGM